MLIVCMLLYAEFGGVGYTSPAHINSKSIGMLSIRNMDHTLHSTHQNDYLKATDISSIRTTSVSGLHGCLIQRET